MIFLCVMLIDIWPSFRFMPCQYLTICYLLTAPLTRHSRGGLCCLDDQLLSNVRLLQTCVVCALPLHVSPQTMSPPLLPTLSSFTSRLRYLLVVDCVFIVRCHVSYFLWRTLFSPLLLGTPATSTAV